MGDMEQYEVNMLRRDLEIMYYDEWWYADGGQVLMESLKFETLLSWFCFEEYCSRCGEFKSADKTSTNHEWYQLVCKHYVPRWDKTHSWDEEVGWVPKGGTC
jgi:hypothetical protein